MSFAKNKKLLLILNPVAGKGQGRSKLFEVIDTFSNHGYRVSVLPTKPNRETEGDIAKEAAFYDLLVAIGGDGTLNNAANGILKSGSDIPMGYIPLGSTNDFAASFELSNNIKTACEFIAKNDARYIDIGRFNDRYFVYIASTGLFSNASYMTSQQLKNALGHSAYLIKGIADLAGTKKMRYKVETENETIGGDFLLASVSNTLRAGGIFTFPKDDVSFDDGYFELTMVKAPNNIFDITNLVNDMLYSSLKTDFIVRRKVKKAKIRFSTPYGFSLDGENGGEHTEATIEVCEKALRFIY